jgi:hypothetical protein
MCITAFAFCYFAFGKHVIETDGMIDGAMLNEFGDFTLYCFAQFLLPFLIAAAICSALSKYKTKLSFLLIALVYAPIWLLAVTWTAEGCAVNFGNTWTTYEVFNSFVWRNDLYGLPLLLGGLLLNKIVQNYLDKPSKA